MRENARERENMVRYNEQYCYITNNNYLTRKYMIYDRYNDTIEKIIYFLDMIITL